MITNDCTAALITSSVDFLGGTVRGMPSTAFGFMLLRHSSAYGEFSFPAPQTFSNTWNPVSNFLIAADYQRLFGAVVQNCSTFSTSLALNYRT